jgi:hypothetical protein
MFCLAVTRVANKQKGDSTQPWQGPYDELAPSFPLCICTIPYAKLRVGEDGTAGPSAITQTKKGDTLCAELDSNSRVTSFAHWRAWELLPTPYRSSLPEGTGESEGIISSPYPMS